MLKHQPKMHSSHAAANVAFAGLRRKLLHQYLFIAEEYKPGLEAERRRDLHVRFSLLVLSQQ